MFATPRLAIVTLAALSMIDSVVARYRWLERDDRFIALYPRRFGQEHPAVIDELAQACPGQVCGTLSGQAITPLLAAQGECTQQDMADAIIDAAQQFDATTKANMIAIAQKYRQAEKNTPPDFSTNPPTNRNSVFCQKAPKNAELNGLVQAQDPANDPDIFFDPSTSTSVKKGSQPDTIPFSTSALSSLSDSTAVETSSSVTPTSTAVLLASVSSAIPDPCVVTVTVQALDVAQTTIATSTASASIASPTASASIGNFGSCSVPQIEFGAGFDGRKETSFQPSDKQSYNHGSAQAIDIISQFICDTLTNSCGADQTAKDTCTQAKAAADGQPPKTGAQADAFNALFGITTDFAAIPALDDLGNVVAGSTIASSSVASLTAASSTVTATAASASGSAVIGTDVAATASVSGTPASGDPSIGNFGTCSVPQIKFGTGFDGRKETSFEPVDQSSYNHGSAQAIGIISQFICDSLTNTCGADQTAKNTCATAQVAAQAQPPKTGAQADAFNAVFGVKTNFAAIAVVNDQGQVIDVSSSAAATATAQSTTS